MRLIALIAALSLALALAAPAYAGDNGEGLLGETDDKLVTFASLGVVVFFLLVTIVGSLMQHALEKRKAQREAVELRRRIGW